jgi:peptidyl-prolyl cis-trans isomerase D
MAAIGTIRKQSGLLIVIIGVALVLFLLGDLFSGGSSLFNNQDVSIGVIGGEEIDQRDFELKVREAIESQYGTEGANDQAKKSIRERVWQQLINEKILQKQYAKLGISVSPDELLDQVQNTQPGSILYQYFSDPQTGQIIEQFRDPQTGGLDSPKVLSAIENLLASENARDWLPIEKAIKDDVAMRKYTALIGKGLFTTTNEAESLYKDKNTTATFSYVVKEFMSIPDEEIEVTDADFNAYYNAHKTETTFQSEEETRNVKFVQFMLTPSETDLAEINAELERLKPLFVADTADTAFVAENSESAVKDMIKFYDKRSLPPMIKDTITKSAIGTVVGPYQAGKSMMISKLSQIKLSPDSVQASHILIRVDDGDTAKISAAKAKLDSLKTVAVKKKNFAELAKEYSDDLGSGEKGGELDWFTKGRMVPPFEKACFEGSVGDMPIVESQFGVHLIYITDQTKPKEAYLLSSVDLIIEPSKYTSDEIYKQASKFAVDHNTREKFEANEAFEILSAEGLRMADDIAGVMGPQSKEVIRWAYESDNNVGDVSNPFELEDKIVVAMISGITEKGTMSLEMAKPFIQPEIIKEKKSEKFKAEFGTYTTLEEASRNAKADIQKANSVRFSDGSLPGGLGREAALIGTALSLKEGAVSKPIVGNRGVFVARLDVLTPAPEGGDINQERTVSDNNKGARADRQAYDALKKEVGVEDNRGKFY